MSREFNTRVRTVLWPIATRCGLPSWLVTWGERGE